jgi:hypothetical protein
LPGEVDTLADRPDHIFVHPRLFTIADGPKPVRSKKTHAWALVDKLAAGSLTAGSDQERAKIREEQENVGTLLAFLWASEQGLFLSPVTLADMLESPHRDHQCKLIVKKAGNNIMTPAGKLQDATSGLAAATHSLMLSMQSAENTRLLKRAEHKSAKSLIRNFSPRQQAQFTKLCTKHMQLAPVMPAFSAACSAEKAPDRATNLIAHESRKWKGTFSASGLSPGSWPGDAFPRKETRANREGSPHSCFTHGPLFRKGPPWN